jgi:hypothetical protein
MRLYLILGGTVAGLLLLIGAFFYGRYVGDTACEERHHRVELSDIKAHDVVVGQAQDHDQQLAAQDTVRQDTIREITREVPKIIDRPVYLRSCVDHDGVQLIARAVAAANGGPPAGGPDGGPTNLLPTPDVAQPDHR